MKQQEAEMIGNKVVRRAKMTWNQKKKQKEAQELKLAEEWQQEAEMIVKSLFVEDKLKWPEISKKSSKNLRA